MTDANCEGFPLCDDRITENDRCVIKIIGLEVALSTSRKVATMFMPPFEEGGAYCVAHVGRYVGMSVSLNLVQLITQERFAPEASNLVRR